MYLIAFFRSTSIWDFAHFLATLAYAITFYSAGRHIGISRKYWLFYRANITIPLRQGIVRYVAFIK